MFRKLGIQSLVCVRSNNKVAGKTCCKNLASHPSRCITTLSNSSVLMQQVQQENLKFESLNKSTTDGSHSSIESTNKFEIINALDLKPMSQFRVLNDDLSINYRLDDSLTDEKLVELYEGMVKLHVFDNIMYECQRQGRISFYMTHLGEEAIQFGSAGALEMEDIIFAQYREAGILMHRKMSLDLMIGQCLGNTDDLGKGRQMPIHYGNKALNFVTISSPLATQMPQAVGAAYALKRQAKEEDADLNKIVVCYFGEGAASEGDAYAAFNFAATLNCPVLFFCRNNGYAISTPASEQYRGDGIVARALGCGISATRIDGNDLMAVYEATKQARQQILKDQKPILIEAMTYRVGHHSTSDDSSAYRTKDELNEWRAPQANPIDRVKNYLIKSQLWSDEREKELRKSMRTQVLESLAAAEKKQKLPISTMFDDVYDEKPARLQEQLDSLKKHLEKFPNEYPVKEYQSE